MAKFDYEKVSNMRAQTNNLVIPNEIKLGAAHAPSAQNSVCAFSSYGMGLQLPVDPIGANKRTVAVGSGYRWRVHVVIDP